MPRPSPPRPPRPFEVPAAAPSLLAGGSHPVRGPRDRRRCGAARVEPLEGRTLLALVYAYEQSHIPATPPVTASWSPAAADYTQVVLTPEAGTATLTVSGIPEHLLLSVYAHIEQYGYGGPPDDTDTITAHIGGQPVQTGIFNDMGSYYFALDTTPFKHESEEITLTLTASNVEPGDSFYLLSAHVETVDPVISVESELITTGDTEEVTVTVTDPSGQPMHGVTLNVDSSKTDTNVIEPQQSSVTTGADGTAILDVKGVAAGYSLLELVAGQVSSTTAPRGAATTQVAPPTIIFQAEEGHIRLHQGQEVTVKAVVVKAGGNPSEAADRVKNKPFDASLVGPEANKLELTPTSGQTDGLGEVEVRLKAKKPLTAGESTSLKITVSTGSGRKPIDVKPVQLSAAPVQLQPAALGLWDLGAKVTDPLGGGGVEGIGVRLVKVDPPAGGGDYEIATGAGDSGADGKVTLSIRGTKAGAVKVRMELIEDPDTFILVDINILL